jgi:hypothetical protein
MVAAVRVGEVFYHDQIEQHELQLDDIEQISKALGG